MSHENQSLSSGTVPEQVKELLHRYEAVCVKLEEMPHSAISDVETQTESLRMEFENLPALPEEYAEIFNKRFAAAVKTVGLFAEEIAAKNNELKKLLDTADAIISAGALATSGEINSIEKKLAPFAAEESVKERLEKLAPQLEQLKAEEAAEAEKAKVCRKYISELEALETAEDFAEIKKCKDAVEKNYQALGDIPAAEAKLFQDAMHKINSKLACHYETLDLARWESYTRKLDLIKKLGQLSAIEDKELNTAAAKLQELRVKWKECGPVPNEKKDEVNNQFLELTRPLQKRIDDYYTALRLAKKAAVEQKELMCKTAEALADSKNWKVTSEQYKAMQADWKQLPHTGSPEKELFTRFRAAADTFFTARDAFYAERNSRTEAAKNAKESLIAKVLELAPEDRRTAKQLREEFKASAHAGKFELELRKRFDEAMDKFFSALKENAAEKANRSSELVEELERLSSDPLSGRNRANEIRSELAKLKVRNNIKKEQDAISKFDRAEKAARNQADGDKFSLYKRIVLELDSSPASKPEGIEKFSRLENVFTLLNSSETDASDKLAKIISSSRKTAEKIIDDLKELAGSNNSAPVSLAMELEAAILGNFARNEAEKSRKSKIADAGKLRQEFMTIYLPADEFSAAAEAFENLFARLSDI